MLYLLINLLTLYKFILIAKIFMSWFNPDRNNPIVSFIDSVTDPVLTPIRNFLPQNGMGIDFSPLVIFFALSLIERMLLGGAYGYYGF